MAVDKFWLSSLFLLLSMLQMNEQFSWQRDFYKTIHLIISGIQRKSKAQEIFYANTMFADNKSTPKIINEIPELASFIYSANYRGRNL